MASFGQGPASGEVPASGVPASAGGGLPASGVGNDGAGLGTLLPPDSGGAESVSCRTAQLTTITAPAISPTPVDMRTSVPPGGTQSKAQAWAQVRISTYPSVP